MSPAMYRVDARNREGVLSDLLGSQVASALKPGDDAFTAIQAMQMITRKLTRNPNTIRITTQLEFNYEGVVDGSCLASALERVLERDWWPSTFAVADYASPEPWAIKAAEEAKKGHTVVMLMPARTNVAWFHARVLGCASEVRFIKGQVQLTDAERANTFPDCLAIFRPPPSADQPKPGNGKEIEIEIENEIENEQGRKKKRLSGPRLRLSTSFTSTRNDVSVAE